MENKLVKGICIILTLMVIVAIALPVFAGPDLTDPSKIVPNATEGSNTAATIAGQILGIVQVIGIAVAVIMLIVLAIKYIGSAANEKAEIKKHAVVYIVGAVLLFGAAGILQLIRGFASSF